MNSEKKNEDKIIQNSNDNNSKDNETIDIDFSSIKNNAKKVYSFITNKAWVIPLFFILITMFFAYNYRMQALDLPITDSWAQSSVENFYLNQFKQQVNANFPDLDESTKNSLAKKSYDDYISKNQDELNTQAKLASTQFKEYYQRDDGTTYLFDLDSYTFYSNLNNYLAYGHKGTHLQNGEPYTDRNAPLGLPAGLRFFHDYVLLFIYYLMNLFGTFDTMQSTLYFVVLLAPLTVIPAFFIVKRITKSNIGGFFSALLIATHQGIVSRTSGGGADTDIYNVLFPLYIIWMFIETLSADNFKTKLKYSVLTSFFVGLYSFTWAGWWYVYDVVIGTMIFIIILEFIKSKYVKHESHIPKSLWLTIKDEFYLLSSLVIASGFFSIMFNLLRNTFVSSIRNFFNFIIGPFGFIKLKAVGITSLWPNIMTTVAELNPSSFDNIVNSIGGVGFLFLAFVSILVLLYFDYRDFVNKSSKITHYKYTLVLVLWFFATLYPAIKAVRFLLVVTPPLIISMSVLFGFFDVYLTRAFKTDKRKIAVKIGYFILLILLVNPLVKVGFAVSQQQVPLMNDMWYDSLSYINNNTDSNAILTSWWDFGYFFTAIAKRPVTFDGGFQVGHDAHWVGKSFLVNDEKKTLGILRMLNCGQNTAFEYLNNFTNNTPYSVDLINDIIVLNIDDAKTYLDYQNLSMSNLELTQLLMYSHCDAPESIYITSGDMVQKAGVWAHFGSWDFNKADMFSKINGKSKDEAITILMKEFGKSVGDANSLYLDINTKGGDNFIAAWPSYYSDTVNCADKGNSLTCIVGVSGRGSISFIVDKKTFDAYIDTNTEDKFYPAKVSYMLDNEIKVHNYKETINDKSKIQDFGLIIIPNKDRTQYSAVLSATELTDSMFTKLFFFNGQGLSCFDKIYAQDHPIGDDKVIVWKADYDCESKNNYYNPIKTVNADHILIMPSTRNITDEEAYNLTLKIKNQINATNFGELAKEYSDDPGSKDNGGALGWFGKGMMVSEFEQEAFSLNVNEIGIVKTQFGYHIIKINEIKLE